MTTRYDASVNGALLSSLDERIIVTDVREAVAREQVSTAERPVTDGSFLLRKNRQSLSVTVAFVLWEQRVEERKALLDSVKTWAGRGIVKLGVNDRPGQYLNVTVDEYPVIQSAMKWTEEITLTFTAYEFPFWRDEEAQTAAIVSPSPQRIFPGNGTAYADLTITNTGTDAFTFIGLDIDSTLERFFISFYGVDMQPGSVFRIYYDERNIMHAEVDGASVLECMEADSADDLAIPCGIPVYISLVRKADETPVTDAYVSVQGVYL